MTLNPTISVPVNGEDREFLMSYGLLNSLAKITAVPENIAAIGADHDLRDAFLLALLYDRTPTGKVTNPAVELFDFELTLEAVDELLTWASMHVTNFFVQAVMRSRKALEHQQELLPTAD